MIFKVFFQGVVGVVLKMLYVAEEWTAGLRLLHALGPATQIRGRRLLNDKIDINNLTE